MLFFVNLLVKQMLLHFVILYLYKVYVLKTTRPLFELYRPLLCSCYQQSLATYLSRRKICKLPLQQIFNTSLKSGHRTSTTVIITRCYNNNNESRIAVTTRHFIVFTRWCQCAPRLVHGSTRVCPSLAVFAGLADVPNKQTRR